MGPFVEVVETGSYGGFDITTAFPTQRHAAVERSGTNRKRTAPVAATLGIVTVLAAGRAATDGVRNALGRIVLGLAAIKWRSAGSTVVDVTMPPEPRTRAPR